MPSNSNYDVALEHAGRRAETTVRVAAQNKTKAAEAALEIAIGFAVTNVAKVVEGS